MAGHQRHWQGGGRDRQRRHQLGDVTSLCGGMEALEVSTLGESCTAAEIGDSSRTPIERQACPRTVVS
jgi:hypothetical protein